MQAVVNLSYMLLVQQLCAVMTMARARKHYSHFGVRQDGLQVNRLLPTVPLMGSGHLIQLTTFAMVLCQFYYAACIMSYIYF